MIPFYLEKWLEGGPWIHNPDSIFEVRKEGPLTKPFILYFGSNPDRNDRIAHELAHLIQCKDEHIFDPTWGWDEFVFSHDPEHHLSTECAINEIEVLVIHWTIQKYLNPAVVDDPRTWVYKSIAFIIRYPEDIKPYDWVAKRLWIYAETTKHEKWTRISNVWDELQRKYEIIRRKNEETSRS